MRKFHLGRGALTLLAAGVVLQAAAMLLSGCDRKSDAAAMPDSRPVRVAPVHLEPAVENARYPAVIRPYIEADVGFRIAGKVTERLVAVGARVEAGTPLARLDTADVELAVRASRAQLESARADAANTRADFERYAQLRQGDWTTRQEYDRRRTQMEKAAAVVHQFESDLNVKVNSLQYTTLVADGPGIVTATLVEPGQVAAAGQTAVRIARLGELEAVANIPENRVATLDKASLSVELWSLPGVRVEGTLRELSPAADAATRTFQARITLKNPPPEVQIGMTATVAASLPGNAPIARLPLTVLTQSGSDPAVWVVKPDGKSLELRPVQVAAYSGNTLIVGGGLAEGETVVSAGVHKLDPQQKVRVWTEPLK
jgi:membrane fusion protein, multidrug efflux system